MLCGEVTSDGTSTDLSVRVCVDLDADEVTIWMTGPSSVWFGVGFDGISMFSGAWTVVCSENGDLYDGYIL